MLSESELSEYLAALTPDQVAIIRLIRPLILESNPTLVEIVNEERWLGGLLTYNLPAGAFVYALGPVKSGKTTLHLMPYYASKELQDKHGATLKKLLTGKSCIQMKTVADVPVNVLNDIFECSQDFEAKMKAFSEALTTKAKTKAKTK